MELLIYHSEVVPIKQYNSSKLYLNVMQYGLDLFSENEILHEELKNLFLFAFSIITKDHLLEPVIDHFTKELFS